MAAIKSPGEIAEALKVDISRWEATSNMELRIDITESMANETRLWDGSSTADPPKPKAHVWPARRNETDQAYRRSCLPCIFVQVFELISKDQNQKEAPAETQTPPIT